MIILGRKYKFTKFELDRLTRKFENITIVPYRGRDPQAVLSEIRSCIEANKYTTIVLNTKSTVDGEIIKYLTNQQFDKSGSHLQITTIEHFLEKHLHKCYIPEDNTDLHFLEDIHGYTIWQYIQKRVIDFFGIFWLFFFSWPVMLVCKINIKRQSPGPIYYAQYRVGVNNKEFKCVKFRSMRVDAEVDGAKFASENDPRIFPWGEVMRKARFDELPQIWNILKGDMHLIGPRPERKVWTSEFEKIIPYYSERHLVRPGVTGWAQVMYPYGANAEDARQKLMYDLYYIKYWNIRLELKIVWMTAMTVLYRKGM